VRGSGAYPAFPNFVFSALITLGGAKWDASPPIEAICRTRVAVIGRTGDDAGRKTVRRSGLAAAHDSASAAPC
jgi:hypothetical protein